MASRKQGLTRSLPPGYQVLTINPSRSFTPGAQWFCLFYQQIVLSSKTPFVASNLLEKLSRQIQVMEKLSAVSDENIGNISSVIEGEPLRPSPVDLLDLGIKPGSPALQADSLSTAKSQLIRKDPDAGDN